MRQLLSLLGCFTNERGALDLQSQSVFLIPVSSQPLHIFSYTLVFNHGSSVEGLAPVFLISGAWDLATFCWVSALCLLLLLRRQDLAGQGPHLSQTQGFLSGPYRC